MSLIEDLSLQTALMATIIAVSACVMTGLVWVGWQRVPYVPRRRVPWRAIDIVVVIAVYIVIQSATVDLARRIMVPGAIAGAAVAHSKDASTEHVIGRLMSEGGLSVILLCVLSAAVVAPLAEEFVFRVLLQGWLEALGPNWRRHLPTLRRWIPRGLGPVLLTSLVFAGMHFRVQSPPISTDVLVAVLTGDTLARCLAVGVAIALVRWRTGATAADFGWMPGKILSDIRLGLGAFAAIVAPIYAMQIGLRLLLPEYLAPDPLPLFFLALALGTLYYRTHRIVPLIVLHAALNGTSLLLAGLM